MRDHGKPLPDADGVPPNSSETSGAAVAAGAQTPAPSSDSPTLAFSSPLASDGEGAAAAPARVPGGSAASVVFLPGTMIGNRYRIIRVLGEGGMGTVYQARDLELERIIALKVIRRELAGSAGILQRFKQELILARHVTHKNVVRIFDLGEADGIKFITMEYVEGEDLRGLLRAHGKFAPAEAANIVQQICRALDAAHAEGIIHRDM